MTGDYSGESGRKADAQAVIDRITEALESRDVAGGLNDPRSLKWDDPDDRRKVREKFGDTSEEAILPGFGPEGHGDNARDDCGNPHPFVCDSCGQSVEFGRTCGQSICTRCAVAWCRDLAINKSAKTRRFRKEKHHHTPDSEHQKIHHEIISPPLGWYYDLAHAGLSIEEAQDVTKEIAKEILDEMRAQGMLIRHSYRGADQDGSIKSERDDRGAWKERLNSGRAWFSDVRGELAWKPHYHAVVVADWMEGGDFTTRIERETGWVLHRITDDNGVSIPNDGAMARALTYSLSHADIQVREDSHNRSAVWEVGSFEGDPLKSSSRFSARPSDLSWADGRVREAAATVLGLQSGTTNCGAKLPAVDEPDELARRILEEIFPGDDSSDVDPDTVLYHVDQGNIRVDVSTTDGAGGDVTVRDAWGEPIGGDGFNLEIPARPESADVEATPVVSSLVDGDQEGGADHADDHVDDCSCSSDERPDECDGKLIPLGEARDRGLLESDEWARDAPHVEEAREVDQEWPEDLERWKAEPPGASIGA